MGSLDLCCHGLVVCVAAGEESEEEEEENEDLAEANGLQALLGGDADADGEPGEGGSEADDVEGDEGEDLDLDDGLTLEDALADMYEEAMAAGIDPDELDLDVVSGDEDELDDEDDDELLDALEGSSSEYETDEEAGEALG